MQAELHCRLVPDKVFVMQGKKHCSGYSKGHNLHAQQEDYSPGKGLQSSTTTVTKFIT